jgi:superkiller protein 3
LAIVLTEQGDVTAAADAYAQAVKLNDRNPDLYNAWGNVLLQIGKITDAQAAFSRSLVLQPRNPVALNGIGLAYRRQGDLTRAIESYTKAIQLNPQYAPAYNNLGRAYADRQEMDKAMEAFQNAIRVDPQNAIAYSNLGNLHRTRGNMEEAIKSLRQAIALGKEEIWTDYTSLGLALVEQNNYDEALQVYRQSLEKNPNYALTHLGLGALFSRKGDKQQALSHYQTALKLYEAAQDKEWIDRVQQAIKALQEPGK